MAINYTNGFGGVQGVPSTSAYTPVAPATGPRVRNPMPQDPRVFVSSGQGVTFTGGVGVPVAPDPVMPGQVDYNNGGISNGVLGYLGIQPDQYAAARSSIEGRQQLYSNDGFGGVQNNPANAPLNAQMAAQRLPALPGLGGMNGRPFTAEAPGNAGGTGGGFGGGMGGGLVQGVNVNEYSQNPYLAQMGTVLTNRVTDNLNRNILPSIRSNAVMAGGFGGSRQGVIEANAMKDANQTISDALTGAYFQDFTNQMNRNLQQYGQNQGFYSNQRGQDLQQTALGADLFQRGNTGFLGQGQGIYGLGTTQQQAPWQVVNNGNAGFSQWSGYGTTTQAGGGAQGALGGALAGGQLWNMYKPNASPNAAGGVNSAGFGTGAGFGNQDFGQFF